MWPYVRARISRQAMMRFVTVDDNLCCMHDANVVTYFSLHSDLFPISHGSSLKLKSENTLSE
jgi:hypothetical protein